LRPVDNRRSKTYDSFLTDELMALEYASRHLDACGAWETLVDIVERAAERPLALSHAPVMLKGSTGSDARAYEPVP
jgi:hypothetical protein